ncbi:rhamnogalacturonan acetylesterase [Paraglaciecola aquimarina]|uniref:Rhamnogalacturonan acetylesterase n=1 Tax=Paraglaciecola algarum TaxID=3050085 RepID=A0ABS9D9F0_9ALTE|nr:rhamnogalacturonan acetylesterase [Paraglaciecola sp. G1-23]MCF2949593.1 rhamnogalacturonan acetylesterase [Paraglaciecola sp. G1-23]
MYKRRLIQHFVCLIIVTSVLVKSTAFAKPQLFMAGDSTMAIKHPKDYPETGWGVPFSEFFSEQISVINLAKNGRSTRTFMAEGLWQKILDDLQKGDFVIIQFGHNDESAKKKDRYTTPQEYQNNLSLMIEQVRKKGAQPILMSSVTRRYFVSDKDNLIGETHPYSKLVRQVAEQTKVTFFDMDKITREYFQSMGDELSSLRFMHIKPSIHPNYPNGVKDNTHFNHLGAREVAQLVLAELKSSNHPLIQFVRKADPKHLTYRYH